MKQVLLLLGFLALLTLVSSAQTSRQTEKNSAAEPGEYLILSKQGSGSITRDLLSFTLASGPNCDQTVSQIPDGSKLVSDNFVMTVSAGGTGVFYGTAKFLSPTGEILHVGILRGSVGLNDCDPADGGVCAAVCTRPGHLEGIYEGVPTFAPNPNGDISMLHFKADLNQPLESPEPTYRARLNGLFSDHTRPDRGVTVVPDKQKYEPNEIARATIANKTEKTIRGSGPLSANCTILDLQRQENGQWVQHKTICPLMYVEKDIPAGESAVVEVRLSEGASPIKPGIYRFVFPYRVVEAGNVNPTPSVIVSPIFQVGEMTRTRIQRPR